MAQAFQGVAQGCHDAMGGLRDHTRVLRDSAAVVLLRARRLDRAGEGKDGRKVLAELVVQLAGERAPLVIADLEQAPGQGLALLGSLIKAVAELADGPAD